MFLYKRVFDKFLANTVMSCLSNKHTWMLETTKASGNFDKIDNPVGTTHKLSTYSMIIYHSVEVNFKNRI